MENAKLLCEKIEENTKKIHELIGGKEKLEFVKITQQSDIMPAFNRILENNRKVDRIVTLALGIEEEYGAREYFYLDFAKNPSVYEEFGLKGDPKEAFVYGFKNCGSKFVEFVRKRYYSI